ncbi:bifunctional riboflavin kinase/FAD synthetase [Streptococcus gallolyticus subsp. gallolyticus]|nr:bifunctional riboflavin kinase/FAD synthetase [Streptococcus gallolyticus]EFM29340.1 riboflavin biosynthesis protein RibF [Streptococcus gallolyticus subsp. gallolyticus TX20005]MCF2565753.1 bifunctional riboflavin kinase/FAD synthetase [Streptococcus pasteurianus]MCF1633239.1 bifunctional riboflavin kinase/FAD synthetase [Streptococcus gallolyticus]MCL4889328.1 bifunctional riboflavin kinase/FAD synthetase [Streptococcus gallolyticus]MCY7155219.1 bifunctional riboflavin kinase/FAD syntheta
MEKMEIQRIKDYKDITNAKDSVLVLGYFDGLHRGHKALFDKAKEIAKRDNLALTVLTFNESPRLALSRFTSDLLLSLTSPEKRYEKFAEYGVDYLYLIDFTSTFSKLSAKNFLENYIKQLRAKTIVVGFDYKFGHDRKDAIDLAQQFNGDVVVVPEVQDNGEKISSTRIRQLIFEGNIKEVNRLLGYNFSTRGIVVHGDARGRTIGFPTANLAPIDNVFLPGDGVYVSDVIVNGKSYRAMTSVGKNVTFGGTELRLEANIFDFKDEIYGETVEIIWLDKIRDMVKFAGADELIEQLKSDKEVAANWKKDSQVP